MIKGQNQTTKENARVNHSIFARLLYDILVALLKRESRNESVQVNFAKKIDVKLEQE